MAEVIKMPRMSDTMTEGVIVAWHKKVGDKIKSGDLLAEIETDKAVMEFESFQNGTLLYIGAEKGQAVPVDTVIAVLGKEGEDYKALLESAGSGNTKSESAAVKTAAPVAQTPQAQPQQVLSSAPANGHSRIKASPLAKKIAQEQGIDIQAVRGTGDEGRIVKRDVESFSTKVQSAFSVPQVTGTYEDIPNTQMRKTIARRLAESKFTAPHFYLKMEINTDNLLSARKQINEKNDIKLSVNDFIIKAVALALKKNPKVNCSWMGDFIRYYNYVNIGMAVAVEDGLVVPVIRNADHKPLSTISAEAKSYASKARERKLQPSDWEGNTFTISNLGMMDIDEFTAIINPPDACILAVGKSKEIPVLVGGQLKTTHVMKVTLSCDHRAVDGALGAAFLQSLKSYLENPVMMLA
ncbi:MAG: pyruvate dehydrogenase complex dihydrolipoamide acetyltransferase [Bacteroidota bacterium]|jgi:pyruvate dehydrogenase E2 component (dihydrolipoamide acetyltransferase)